MKRRYLRLLSLVLVTTLLYAQIAVAAYACPGLARAATTNTSMVPSASSTETGGDQTGVSTSEQTDDCAGMPGGIDPSAPKLCADHCNYGQQSDQTPNLSVPPVLLNPLYIAPPMPLPSMPAQPPAELSALVRGSPPLAILHCCFRI